MTGLGTIDILGGAAGSGNSVQIVSGGDMDINNASLLTIEERNGGTASLTAVDSLDGVLTTLTMNGGLLSSSFSFTRYLDVGTFNWNGGTQSGGGETVVNTLMNFTGAPAAPLVSILDGRILGINPDTVLGDGNTLRLLNDADLQVGFFTNRGTLEVVDTGIPVSATISGDFTNEGVANFSGFTRFLDSSYIQGNSGTTIVRAGAALAVDNRFMMTGGNTVVDAGGTLVALNGYDQTGGTTLVNGDLSTSDYSLDGGSLDVVGVLNADFFDQTSGTTTLSTGGVMNVLSTYTMLGGDTFLNPGSVLNTDTYTQDGGTTTFNYGGALNATTAVNINGGSVVGDLGSITAPTVNVGNLGNAIIAPGFSPGTLNIFGNLILSSTSTLNFEVGPNSTIYDIINVSGNINFGGATLNLSWFSGYTPTLGYSYQLFTFGSNPGNTTFGSITAPVTLTSTYNLTNLLLAYSVATATGTGAGGTVPPGSGSPSPGSGLSPPEVPVISAFDGNVFQLVVAMWEDAFSQWVNDPLDYNNGFILTGALNGDNGERDTGGRGQKVFLPEWDPESGGRGGKSGPVCNSPTVL